VEMNTYKFNTPNYRSWQSELTFNGSAFSDRVKWTGGLFYFNEFSPNDGGLLYLFLPAAGGAPSAVSGRQLTITDSRGNSEQNRSYAAYAQATWTVIDGTRLTAGMRYTYDERYAHIATQTIRTPSTQALATTQNGVFNPGALSFEGVSYTGTTTTCTLTSATGAILPLSQCAVDINRSYHKPTFTLALDHDLWDGTMLYGTMRSGYRSGAINTQGVNTAALVAAPEQVLDYEIGVKSDFAIMGTPVRTNLAAYQTVYHDIQVQQQVPNITTATAIGGGPCTQTALNAGQCLGTFNDNITLNAKSARIYGFEWEAEVLPTDWLTLSASGSYIDPRYTDYTFLVPPGYLQPSSNTNLSGTPIPVPAWQTNETATFNLGHDPMGLPLGDASFTAHYYWQSRYLADMRNYDPSQRTFAYGLLNLRLEFKDFLRRNLDFALYANNVVGTQACLPEYTGVLNSAPNGTFGQPGTSGLLQCVPLAPRMVGAQLTYRF